MAQRSYQSLNVNDETHSRVADVRDDNRLASMDAAVCLLLDAYEADADADADAETTSDKERRLDIDNSEVAREVAAKIDYVELAQQTASELEGRMR